MPNSEPSINPGIVFRCHSQGAEGLPKEPLIASVGTTYRIAFGPRAACLFCQRFSAGKIRTSTVTATSDAEVLRLSGEAFHSALAGDGLMHAAAQALATERRTAG